MRKHLLIKRRQERSKVVLIKRFIVYFIVKIKMGLRGRLYFEVTHFGFS